MIVMALLCLTAKGVAAVSYVASTVQPPSLPREFRGAWVPTVGNMQWPSKPGLPVSQQKAELLAILDRAAQLKLNAIIFQVRPACDAFYSSKLEPWSEYLTGQMGKAPEPLYDPLAFAVTEAHKRGLELHAWFNPFRARYRTTVSSASGGHVSRVHPELVKDFGDGDQMWLDPGEKASQDLALAVVKDVVHRYDVDGVHIDDYFYPDPKSASGRNLGDFPDEPSWKKYQAAKGKLSRNDWRRENINTFVKRLNEVAHAEKSWMKFGVSPAGLWSAGYPAGIGPGMDAYKEIFADAKLWLNQGWADYFAPQLYWPIDSTHSFPALLKWWSGENKQQRHLWPGLFDDEAAKSWKADEIVQQVLLQRKAGNDAGQIHFSMKALMGSSGAGDMLTRHAYTSLALVPSTPWLDNKPPGKPRLVAGQNASGNLTFRWEATGSEKPWMWIFQSRSDGKWSVQMAPVESNTATIAKTLEVEVAAVSAVDRCGNVSAANVLERRVK